MPWKVSSVMDERLRFVARLLEGDAMTDLCVEFGVSRKTRELLVRRLASEIRSATSANAIRSLSVTMPRAIF